MSKSSFIDSVEVAAPCHESWDEMAGSETVRFCSHCAETVTNLSAMTRKQAARLVRASNGKLCVRFVRDARTRQTVFAAPLFQITRRAPGIAAGVMTASIALSAQAYAQSPVTTAPTAPATVEKLVSGDSDVTVTDAITPKQIAELPINGTRFVSMGMVAITPAVQFSNPLTRAADAGDVEAVRDLIARGANVRTREKDGTTPLAVAIESGNVEIARILLDAGARINAADREKRSPIMKLDEDATPDLANLLIIAGARLDVRDRDGDTPLIAAARSVPADVLEVLIRSGADVNAANKDGETPLMMAADNNDIDKVRLLIMAGADVNAKNKAGDTAWDLTTDDDIESLLVSFGAVVKDDPAAEPVEKPPVR